MTNTNTNTNKSKQVNFASKALLHTISNIGFKCVRGSKEFQEDVVQEACLKLFKSGKWQNISELLPPSYISRVCRSIASDMLSKAGITRNINKADKAHCAALSDERIKLENKISAIAAERDLTEIHIFDKRLAENRLAVIDEQLESLVYDSGNFKKSVALENEPYQEGSVNDICLISNSEEILLKNEQANTANDFADKLIHEAISLISKTSARSYNDIKSKQHFLGLLFFGGEKMSQYTIREQAQKVGFESSHPSKIYQDFLKKLASTFKNKQWQQDLSVIASALPLNNNYKKQQAIYTARVATC